MLDGRVTVNGATIRELGTKADPARDDIRVDGRRDQDGRAPPLHPAEQAARLRDDAIGSAAAADRDRSAARRQASTSTRSDGSTTTPKGC